MSYSQVKVSNIVRCSLFSALIAVGAFIQIPVPFMDYFTLQFLFVILSGLLLGSKLGAISVSVYVLTGIIGFPVFAGGGGILYILRPSFGYLIGFIFSAWLVGIVSEKLNENTYKNMLIASFCGLFICYFIGLIYKYIILNLYIGTPTGWIAIFLSCFPLDVPGDILLCILGSILAVRIRPIIKKKVGDKIV